MTTEIDRDQLAAILDQIADYSAPADMGAHIRILTGALRGNGLVIINGPAQAAMLAGEPAPEPADRDTIKPEPDGIRKIGQDGMLSHETIRVRSDQ